MPDQVPAGLAPVEIHHMQPDHLDLESGRIGQYQQLHQWHDEDDPDHDFVAEELDKFFSYDEEQCSHIRQALF
jgi:hypothetical protein